MGIIISLVSSKGIAKSVVQGGVRRCTSLPFDCVKMIQRFLNLREMMYMRLVNKTFNQCIDCRDYHKRACEALFGNSFSCSYFQGFGSVSPKSVVSQTHMQKVRSQKCWWQCIVHIYKIQVRFGVSNTVVSTAASMLEKILENYHSVILSNPHSGSPEVEDYELCACMLCYVASKYEDAEPLSLKNIKFYSRNRIFSDNALQYELLLLSIVDPSVSMHSRNMGMFLDSLHMHYVLADCHVFYRTFFKV